jgi:hypothetical protein
MARAAKFIIAIAAVQFAAFFVALVISLNGQGILALRVLLSPMIQVAEFFSNGDYLIPLAMANSLIWGAAIYGAALLACRLAKRVLPASLPAR